MKNAHPVSGARIQTHNPLIMSLLPYHKTNELPSIFEQELSQKIIISINKSEPGRRPQ